MVTEHHSTAFAGFRQDAAPDDSDHPNGSIAVGDLWSDTSNNLLKRCSSISPITWVSTEGGSSAHDILSSTHDATDPGGAESRGDLIRRGASAWERVALGNDGESLKSDGTDPTWEKEYFTLGYTFNGGGSAISSGEQGDTPGSPHAGVIERVEILLDQSATMQVDIWKDTYANFPPTDADSITASAVPATSAADKYEDETLTGWTTTISQGDILRFNVDSNDNAQRGVISVRIRKT